MLDTTELKCNFTIAEKDPDLGNTYKIIAGDFASFALNHPRVLMAQRYTYYSWKARIFQNVKTGDLYCTSYVNRDARCRMSDHLTLYKVEKAETYAMGQYFEFKIGEIVDVLFIPFTREERTAARLGFISKLKEQEKIMANTNRNIKRCKKASTIERNKQKNYAANAEYDRITGLYYDSILTE